MCMAALGEAWPARPAWVRHPNLACFLSRSHPQSSISMSDYGSDTGLDELGDDGALVAAFHRIRQDRPTDTNPTLPTTEWEAGDVEDEEQHAHGFVQIHGPTVLRLAKNRTNVPANLAQHLERSPAHPRAALEVEYDARSRRAWSGNRFSPFSVVAILSTQAHP